MDKTQEVFTHILKNRVWGGPNGESVSGTGSTVLHTKKLRQDLIKLCLQYKFTSFADVVGDANWIKLVDFPAIGVKYTGIDVVPELVELAKQRMPYGTFQVADLTKDDLPEADVILVRDVLVHMPYAMILKSLANIKRSKIRYLLTTSFPGRVNKDIKLGDWRTLDLQGAPFNLPAPVEVLHDYYPHPGFDDKRLMMFDISKL